MSAVNIWEAVDNFNERSAAGRVVVNPPARRGKVEAHRTQELWYLCKCGRGFSSLDRHLEHKLTHTDTNAKLDVKVIPSQTEAIFKNYNKFRVKKENGRVEKVYEAEIEAAVAKKLDYYVSRFEEDTETKIESEIVTTEHIVKTKIKTTTCTVSSMTPTQKESRDKLNTNQITSHIKEDEKKSNQEIPDVTPSDLTKLSTSESPDKVPSVKCYQCGKVFTKRLYLILHNKHKHPTLPNFNSSTPTAATLSRGPSCQDCKLNFQSPVGLFRHRLLKHKGLGAASCKVCKQKCLNSDSLDIHMRKFHKSFLKGTHKRTTRPTRSKISKLVNVTSEDKVEEACDLPDNLNVSQNNEIEANMVVNGILSRNSEYQNKRMNFRAARSGTLMKSPRKDIKLKHPESHSSIPESSLCSQCDRICGGTCNVQLRSTSLRRRKLQKKLISRMVSLRSAARKMSEEVSKMTPASFMELSVPEIQTNIAQEDTLQTVASELVISSSRSLRSITIESRLSEKPVENGTHAFPLHNDQGDIFYDAVGTRTRSKNATENESSGMSEEINQTIARRDVLSVNTEYICKICGQQTFSARSLSQHTRWRHSGKRNRVHVPTHTKNRSGSTENILSDQMEVEEDNVDNTKMESAPDNEVSSFDSKQVKCKTCNILVAHRFYKRHLSSQAHTKHTFDCKTCGKTFKYSSMLKIHTKVHGHSSKSTFDCDKCDKKFAYPSMLKVHIAKRHITSDSVRNETTAFECSVCYRKFKSPSTLLFHMKCHEPNKNFSCETCCKTFINHSELNRHNITKHSVTKSNILINESDTSGEKCKYKGILRLRPTAPHEPESPTECDICNLQLKNKSEFRKHSKVCHVPGGKFACSDCPCVFGNSVSMRIHMGRRHKRDSTLKPASTRTEEFHEYRSSDTATSSSDELKKSSPSSGFDAKIKPVQTDISSPQDAIPNSTSPLTKNNSTLYLVKCKLCGFSVSKNMYAHHLQVAHVKSGKFPCDICCCVFISNNSRLSHVRHGHNRKHEQMSPTTGDVSIHTRLRRHSTSLRKNEREPKTTEKQSIIPPPDQKLSNCSLCKLVIPGGTIEMAAHKKNAHVKNSEYGCNYCSCAFSDDHGLKLHLSSVVHVSTNETSETSHAHKTPEKKTTPTKQECQQQSNADLGFKNHSPVRTRNKMDSNVTSRARARKGMVGIKDDVLLSTATSMSTSSEPSKQSSYKHVPELFKITDDIMKSDIQNTNLEPETDSGIPVIINCFSQNPEYLKKHSPQKPEFESGPTSISQSLSAPTAVKANGGTSANGIRTSTTSINSPSIVWSPPRRTSAYPPRPFFSKTHHSEAIQNLLKTPSTRSVTAGSAFIPRIIDVRSSTRNPVVTRGKGLKLPTVPATSTTSVTQSILESPPLNDSVFKVPLPPSSLSSPMTASAIAAGRMLSMNTIQQFQPAVSQELNKFVFPTLNDHPLSSDKRVAAEGFRGEDSTVAQSPIAVQAFPAAFNAGTYVRVGNVETVSFSQAYGVSSLGSKSQNEQSCPIVATPRDSLSAPIFQVQPSLFSNSQQNHNLLLQNQAFANAVGGDKNNAGPLRTRLVTCSICMKSFFSQAKLTNHMKIHEADSSKGQVLQKPKHGGKCGYCGNFFLQGALWAHLKECVGPGSPTSSKIAANSNL